MQSPVGGQPAVTHGPPFWRSPGFVYALLAIITLALFAPARHFDFVGYDDSEYVKANDMVQRGLSAEGVAWAFTTFHSANWHPLTWLSHMLDAELTGPSAAGPHLINILWHTANALLLLHVLRLLTGSVWRSAFVAALFALHPLHVESVAWISERKDVLSTFFGLLSLWAYTLYARASVANPTPPEKSKRIRYYVVALSCFTLGLLSKPMLVTWPFLMLLLDYWPLRRFGAEPRPWIGLVREKLPFFLLSLGSCFITILAQQQSGAVATLTRMSLGARIGNAFVSYVRYLGQAIWPSDLIIPRLLPTEPWPFLAVAGCAIALGIISGLAIWLLRQRPYVAVGWFWFLGTLVPVIGALQVGGQALADRYTYVPLIGVFVVVAWAGTEAIQKFKVPRVGAAIMGVALLGLCAFATARQLRYWRNSETLFQHTLAVAPENSMAHFALGAFYSDAGRVAEAIEHYQDAQRALPDHPDVLNGLGMNLIKVQRFSEAKNCFEQVLKTHPKNADAYNNLGTLMADSGNYAEAIQYYQAAIQASPAHTVAHFRLGNALLKTGRTADAVGEYEIALRQRPDNVDLLNNLGAALLSLRRFDEAAAKFETVLRLQPDNVNAQFNLGNIMARSENWSAAAERYAAALKLAPNNATIHYGLGLALARQGRRDEAKSHFIEALRLNPNDAKARKELEALQGTSP